MFNRILVAVDGSSTAARGLKSAIDLAADQHATLYILHVVEGAGAIPPGNEGLIPAQYIETMIEALRESGRKIVAKSSRLACDRGLDAPTLVVETLGRTVAHTILAEARRHKADIIVMGTHGRRGLRRVLLGSDAENVLHEARVPVMLVRSPEPPKRHARAVAPRSKRPSTSAATSQPAARRELQ